ncbi:sensor histidine kinase [Nonomuraea diastatica]|nr:histidine kinase [Nonomuraea diastatica]
MNDSGHARVSVLAGAVCATLAVTLAAFVCTEPLSALGASVCVGAAVLAAILFHAHRSTTTTAVLTFTAASVSIGLTSLYSPPAGSAEGVATLAEASGLIVLILLSARFFPVRAGVVCCLLAGLATSVLVLRLTEITSVLEGLGMSLFGGALACAAVVAGAHGRRRHHVRERQAIQVRRSQRIELAKDLHDFLGHELSGILVQAQAAIAVAEDDPAQQGVALRGIEADALRALSTLDRTVRTLWGEGESESAHESTAQKNGVRPAAELRDLPELVHRFDDSGTAHTELNLEPGVEEIVTPEVGATIFRIVVEALTNVRKHAPDATTVKVRVASTWKSAISYVTVEVTSDRTSEPANPLTADSDGFGLIALRERVEVLGGTFSAGFVEPSRWHVKASFPREKVSWGPESSS